MILRLSRAALIDVGALFRDSIGCLLIDLGRWLSDDRDPNDLEDE